MTKSDKLIPEYQAAIRAMRNGKFDSPITVDHNDEIGKLGHDLDGWGGARLEHFTPDQP